MVMAGRDMRELEAEYQAAPAPDASLGGLMLPGTPYWWRDRLLRGLVRRDRTLRRYEDYYDGEHPLLFQTQAFRKVFGQLFVGFADNWCPLVVDAVEERLEVAGFRVGTDPQAPGDSAAWDQWQLNHMDAESSVAHTDALIEGESSVLVWGSSDGPVITVEHPLEMIVECEAGSRYRRSAALKRWTQDDGTWRVTLYLPDALYKWRSDRKVSDYTDVGRIVWREAPGAGEPWPLPNPLKVVPVVPLWTKPRGRREATSELASVIPQQNMCNKLLADMMVASEFAGFRQRWATGIELPVDPKTGKTVEPFTSAVNRLWVANPADEESPAPSFGEFDATDLNNYVHAVELIVQHIASQTRTPPHYFYLGGGQPPSGESIKSAESGLVAKSHRRMLYYGQSWEEVQRLVFLVLRDPKSEAPIETVWKDPEFRSEGEHVDAITKKRALGIPDEVLWQELGYTPQQVESFKRMRLEQSVADAALVDAAAAIAPPPAVAPEPASAPPGVPTPPV
jgi:hypothetical protein